MKSDFLPRPVLCKAITGLPADFLPCWFLDLPRPGLFRRTISGEPAAFQLILLTIGDSMVGLPSTCDRRRPRGLVWAGSAWAPTMYRVLLMFLREALADVFGVMAAAAAAALFGPGSVAKPNPVGDPGEAAGVLVASSELTQGEGAGLTRCATCGVRKRCCLAVVSGVFPLGVGDGWLGFATWGGVASGAACTRAMSG